MMNIAVVIVMSLAVVYAAPTTETAPMPCICTMEYRPVCGQDGVTYGNACGMNCVGVELAHVDECGCLCPRILDPVCGSDGKTYGNTCLLKCAGVELAHAGECACVCPKILDPVCGSDGKTYGNKCMLTCAGAALMSMGSCDMARASLNVTLAAATTTAAPLPPCICAFIYLPVCGSDGVTYGNKCSLDCVSSTGVTQVSEGECPTNGSTKPPLGLGQGK